MLDEAFLVLPALLFLAKVPLVLAAGVAAATVLGIHPVIADEAGQVGGWGCDDRILVGVGT